MYCGRVLSCTISARKPARNSCTPTITATRGTITLQANNTLEAASGSLIESDNTIANPTINHGVSDGLHKLIAKTAVSKRFRYADPYIGFWYQLPVARDDSLFIDYGFTQKNKDPQQQAGTVFGIEGIPWERPDAQYKVAIQAQGRIEAHFDGRGYSEAWEMFAGSDALKCDPMWNPSCDTNSNARNRYQGAAFTGLTVIENYATLGADLALVVQAGKYVHFHLGFNYQHDQNHFITIDDVGKALVDNPMQAGFCQSQLSGGRVHQPCDFNPAYRPVINQIGRRYKIDNSDLYNLGLWAQIMF